MGRSGKFSRRNDREARRAAQQQMDANDAPAIWERPPKEEWDPPSEFSVALSATSRLFVRTNNYRGKCIDFAICHQVGGPYRWRDIFRVDSSHDTVHRHDLTRGTDQRETIESINGPLTVDRQYTEQYDFMLATWEQREREQGDGRVDER
ncbi:DUF7718 family protein [Agromyces bauzanensis]|uniref:DUF7718 domain-containing protein n=2 Tax=Agromyces bauzanensis TaxID=1308924 RepID=A0A917PQ58_9MICO|nr:hypothetical protein GCM10011372_26760 [Agromyces bauzanensis]